MLPNLPLQFRNRKPGTALQDKAQKYTQEDKNTKLGIYEGVALLEKLK